MVLTCEMVPDALKEGPTGPRDYFEQIICLISFYPALSLNKYHYFVQLSKIKNTFGNLILILPKGSQIFKSDLHHENRPILPRSNKIPLKEFIKLDDIIHY